MKILAPILVLLAVIYYLPSFASEVDPDLSAPGDAPAPACPPFSVCQDEDTRGLFPEWGRGGLACNTEDAEEEGLPEVPTVVNESVESYIRYFQSSGRRDFQRRLSRLADFEAMTKPILRDEGLPEDLLYIAVIESGLNPRARSRRNAVGVWQFMEGTAKMYGLRVDWWIDERIDPEKSTRAAAKYLKALYGRFGSWHLAVAGYNAGEGRVSKAAMAEGTSDFWALAKGDVLKKETKDFVPKYLAAMAIARDPESFGFETPIYEEKPAYEKVDIPYAMDLKIIARAAKTTVEEIKRLNPELLKPFTPPNYEGFELKLPVGSSELFKSNIKKAPPPENIKFLRYRVRRGDTVWNISKKFGTGVKPILYLNSIESPRRLKPGMSLMIPVVVKDSGIKRVDVVKMSWDLKG